MNDKETSRIYYLDILRILATIAVIGIHVSAQGWYSEPIERYTWSIFSAWDAAVRWAVPGFVMISGALFLTRKIDMKRVYSHNIRHMVCAFVFWSLMYAIYFGRSDVKTFIGTFIRGYNHMWYVLFVIGLYMSLPVLNAIAKDETALKTFLKLWVAFTVLTPFVTDFLPYMSGTIKGNFLMQSVISVLGNIRVEMVLGYFGFFLLGYYLHTHELTERQENLIMLGGVIGFFYTYTMTVWVSRWRGGPQDFFYNSFSWNVCLETMAFFVWAKKTQWTEKRAKLIRFLSVHSFGVYLIHYMIMMMLNQLFNINTRVINAFVSVPLIMVLTYGISLAIIVGIRKIPKVGRWIV
jgi:surface polysaccharide O-acyltransferase-like enzyme